MPVILQDHVHQPIDQGDIGARTVAQVQRGKLGDIDAARVGDNQFDAALATLPGEVLCQKLGAVRWYSSR